MDHLTEKRQSRVPKIGERTLVMGILNVTPDSFSDGGKFFNLEQAVGHALELVQSGADILDIGGESTRPGYQAVSEEEELNRVIPVIEAVRRELPDIPISIDTYKAGVAREAIRAGADIINDIWRCLADPQMAHVAAEHDVPIILMHNRDNTDYDDIMNDMWCDLQESIALVRQAGVKEEQIWLDPGIGFAKTYEQNLEVMARLGELTAKGYPVLLATSRKRFIGTALDLPVEERLEGTLATICFGVQQGCRIVRVHDVKETVRVCRMMDAMLQRRK